MNEVIQKYTSEIDGIELKIEKNPNVQFPYKFIYNDTDANLPVAIKFHSSLESAQKEFNLCKDSLTLIPEGTFVPVW